MYFIFHISYVRFDLHISVIINPFEISIFGENLNKLHSSKGLNYQQIMFNIKCGVRYAIFMLFCSKFHSQIMGLIEMISSS